MYHLSSFSYMAGVYLNHDFGINNIHLEWINPCPKSTISDKRRLLDLEQNQTFLFSLNVMVLCKLFYYFFVLFARYRKEIVNPLSAKFIKWSNTLKQIVGKLPTICLSVFDHFSGLVLKGLSSFPISFFVRFLSLMILLF